MKSIKLFTIILVVVLLLIGCSSEKKDSPNEGEDVLIKNDDEKEPNDEQTDESVLEKDELLLESLDLNGSDNNLSYKVKLVYGDNQEPSITEVALYYGNIKEINHTPEGKNIMIYNVNEGATYQYIDGESTGIVFYSNDEEDVKSTSVEDLESLFYSGELVKAKTIDYNGESVVYVETLDDTITNKIWFSKKYKIPIKIQMYEGEVLSYETEIYDIKRLGAGDDVLFVPPNDVEFTNFDIYNMEDEDL